MYSIFCRINHKEIERLSERSKRNLSLPNRLFKGIFVHFLVTAQTFPTTAPPYICHNNPIDLQTGVVTSPNYPRDYPPNTRCEYNIITTPGLFIELQMNDFATEPCCDFLYIYDGPALTSPLIRKLLL